VLTKPAPDQVLTGRMLDLSAGGIRVSIPDPSIEWTIGARVICEFQHRPEESPIRLETRLQHIEAAANGHRSIGFQFVGLDTSLEGQRRLAHLASIVTSFQRLSRHRTRPHLPVGPRSR